MTVTEADHVAALSIAKLLRVELEEWQEFVLVRVLASHRERGTDNTPCTSALVSLDGSILVCTERGPHRVHHDGETAKWVRTCGVVSLFEPGAVCRREPHPVGTAHSSGTHTWV